MPTPAVDSYKAAHTAASPLTMATATTAPNLSPSPSMPSQDNVQKTTDETPVIQDDGPGPATNKSEPAQENVDAGKSKRGVAFWSIIVALCVTSVLSSLEGTVVSTALPTIVERLGGQEIYIWAVNSYFLTSMVFQPLYGQMANILGRRNLMIFATTIFIVGSAICGAAQNMSMLIAGRAIQGVGGGGLNMLTNLIISDIVPLRERGSFMAYLFATVIIGTGIGPFVGGIIVQRTTWRWVFFLNLPMGGLALLLTILFLRVTYKKDSSISHRLKRIDFIGNAVFIPSVVAILLALTWGGTTLPWSSWRVVLPLVLGFVGLGLFSTFESSRFCVEPTMPPKLFMNRTSASAFALAFIQTALLYWVIYYLPIYFQGVYGSSPSRSGIQLLPTVLIMIPFAAISGKLLTRFGKYRPFHWAGFSLAMIGLGCFTLLGPRSSTAAWVCYQGIIAAGLGLISSTTLPAVLAPLGEQDVATATGTWAFLRSFGIIWGVSIPGAVFNNRFSQLVTQIADPATRALLQDGGAYEHATKDFVDSFSDRPILRAQIIAGYNESLRRVWQVAIAVAGLAFLLVFVEKEVALRTGLKTDYGIEERKKEKAGEAV